MTAQHPALSVGQPFQVGEVSVARVTEQHGPGFAPDFLLPDWDPAILQERRAEMLPDLFSEAEGKFISSIQTWVVRTRHHTILATRASRRWLLDHAAERQAAVFTAHFACSSAGRIARRGDGFDWRFL